MVARTLAEAIELSGADGNKHGYRFIRNEKFEHTFVTYAQVEQQTREFAGSLQAVGLRKGDRLALIMPDADQFVVAFLAALRVGVAPVPVYPPSGLGQLAGYIDNARHIVKKSGAKVILAADKIKPLLGAVQAHCPELQQILTFAEVQQAGGTFSPVSIAPEDMAFMQFTSGSTSRPKGVVLSHSNLMANCHSIIIEGLKGHRDADAGFTWLPLFHDMGLIGFVLSPIVYGIDCTFMSPLMYLKRPSLWLRGIHEFRGTISFGPNFSYGLCVKRVKPEELQGIDLKHWRIAGCGSEPIRADVLGAFASYYKPYGFDVQAFRPAFGMAEATLAVSFAKGIPVDRVDATKLWANNQAVPVEQDRTEDVLNIVSCGKAFERHEIGIFPTDDPHSSNPLADRQIGEIRIKGPSVMAGYYQEPELNEETFADGWLRSGDLGYLVDGALHICGRLKEVVIINGRNYYPNDIEGAAARVPGVNRGDVIAFGTGGPLGGKEAVIIAYETTQTDEKTLEQLERDIRGVVQEVTGVMLDDVIALAPGGLPKTASGKLQRTKARAMYQQGELKPTASLGNQAAPPQSPTA